MNQKISDKLDGLFEVLQKVRTRPGMYIGQPSVSNLFMFLIGYETARDELGIELTKQEELFCEEFQPWLQRKFRVNTVRSWAHIILTQTNNDEKQAFAQFFDLLDEFLSLNNQDKLFLEPGLSHHSI